MGPRQSFLSSSGALYTCVLPSVSVLQSILRKMVTASFQVYVMRVQHQRAHQSFVIPREGPLVGPALVRCAPLGQSTLVRRVVSIQTRLPRAHPPVLSGGAEIAVSQVGNFT